MIFDVYYPTLVKGAYIPGIKPIKMEWNDIVRKVASIEEFNNIIDEIRKIEDPKKQAELKKRLPCIGFVGSCIQGKTRAAANMIPTQLVMIDIDHCTNAKEAFANIKRDIEAHEDIKIQDFLFVAHITPRLGLRLIFAARPELTTLKANMEWFANTFKISQYGDFDTGVKDFSRLSFLFKKDELLFQSTWLYTNTLPELKGTLKNSFNDGNLFPETKQQTTENESTSDSTETTPVFQNDDEREKWENEREFSEEERADLEDYDYNGYSLKTIAEKWVETQGKPGRSQVHNFYNEMIKYFRNICDNNKRLLLYILPRFGHTIDECKSQIESICRVNTLSSLPKPFYFFLKDNGFYQTKSASHGKLKDYMLAEEENTSDPLPWLPPVFREFVTAAPRDFRISLINSLLPIMGTLTSYLKARYYFDNREHTTSFFSIVYAPAGTGKSFVDMLMDELFVDIRIRDYITTAREQIFMESLNKKGANDKAPDYPHTQLRIIEPKNSEAEFLQKQADNGGYHMFTFAAEMDSWAKGVKAAGGNKDDMIRIAWDNGKYGQHFKGSNTFKGSVNLYWNVLITGTIQQILSYFKNVENGLITRCSFTTIENQKYAEPPIWKPLNKKAKEIIRRFTKRCDLNSYVEPCTLMPEDINIIDKDKFDEEVNWRFTHKERVEVDMEWLKPTILKFLKTQLEMAALAQDDARDVFRRRTAVRGFRLGMMCYALWDKPRQQDLKKCIPFIEWWMKKDIESSLTLWGTRYNNEVQAQPTLTQRSLFNDLSDKFSTNDVYAQCLKQGIKTPVRCIISIWKKQGYVNKISKTEYEKTKKQSVK